MRRDDELRKGGATEQEPEPREAGRSAGEGDGRVPAPDPEEVPELLGERSDYPIPRGEPR